MSLQKNQRTLLIIALVLAALVSLVGTGYFASHIYNQVHIATDLSGSWYGESETIDIYGNQVEITGYYEYDGQRLAGVVTPGVIKAHANDSFTIYMGTTKMDGYIVDEYTIIIEGCTYSR